MLLWNDKAANLSENCATILFQTVYIDTSCGLKQSKRFSNQLILNMQASILWSIGDSRDQDVETKLTYYDLTKMIWLDPYRHQSFSCLFYGSVDIWSMATTGPIYNLFAIG